MNKLDEKLYNTILLIMDNIDKYNNDGYNILYDLLNKQLIVNYKNSKDYFINIIEDNNTLYWKLQPYNNSNYTTDYDNGLDIVLFAIKENEEYYNKEHQMYFYVNKEINFFAKKALDSNLTYSA